MEVWWSCHLPTPNLTFIKVGEKMLNKIGSRTVLLATDDLQIIEETKNYPQFTFIYLPRQRRAGNLSIYYLP